MAEECATRNAKLVHELEENVKREKEVKEAKAEGSKGLKKVNKEESSILYLDGTKLGTVLFFDEANTTDSVDLIKEIMCDRTLYGRSIHKDVQVVAACNPYRV